MKTVIKIIGILMVGFILAMVGSYLVYPYLNPKQAIKVKKMVENTGLPPEYDFTNFNPLKVDTLNRQIDQLRTQLQKALADKTDKMIIDSLQKITGRQADRIAGLEDSLSRKEEIASSRKEVPAYDAEEVKFQEVSKSLLTMDEDALAPILAKLDDHILVGLYLGSSNIQRQKLLQSLTPARAANLLKKVTP